MLEDADTWRFRVDIPEELKYVLISDHNLVCLKKSLFGLPAKTSVSNILSEYAKHAEQKQLENSMAIVEIMSGLKGLYPHSNYLITSNIYSKHSIIRTILL